MTRDPRWEGFYDEALETMRPERRAQVHGELLREALRHAYERAPAARRKIEEAGIRLGEIGEVGDLRRIPVTRKADLKHIQQAALPFGGLAAAPPREMRRIYVSPGPTYDPEGREGSHWRWEKAFFAAGFREGDIVQNTFSYHLSPAGLMFDEALQRIGCVVVPAGVGNTELQAQVMKELSVTGYAGTPSFLMTLLEKAKEAGYCNRDGLKLQVALVAGEMLPESLRSRIREEFGVEVRQAYGTADAGAIGYECREASGMHVPDDILLELLDPVTGDAVPEGAIGEVVVTLPNRTYPLIRFATGDLSILSFDPCPCGRTSARLLKIAGRVDQVTKVKGMFVHPEQVARIEGRIAEIATAQIVVSRVGHEDRMEIRVVTAPGVGPSERLTARIVEETREATRLGGTVLYVGPGDMEEGGKKIIDRRKWE